MNTATLDAPVFESTHGALMFAFRFSSQQYGKSALATLMAGPSGTGKGLGGLDGAGQAGMIKRMTRDLGELHEAIVTARFLPRDSQCSCGSACCSGKVRNLEWAAAVSKIGAMAITATPGCVSNRQLRCGVVAKHFGENIDIGALADHCGVHRNTASKQSGLILAWLKGRPAKAGREAIIGEEGKAMLALDAALQGAGLSP